VADYEKCIKRLLPFFGDLELKEIHIGHFEQYQQTRMENAGASRINHEANTLSQVLRRAGLWSTLAPHYRPLSLPRTGPARVLTDAEAEHFIQVAGSKPRWRLALLCSILTANTTAGPSELLQLRLKDVDLVEWSISVVGGAKNRYRVRTIPLNDEARSAVTELVAIAHRKGSVLPEHYLLPHRAHAQGAASDPTRPMTSWKKAMARIRQEAGKKFPVLVTVKPYYWRFHSITRMLENPGVAERSVMDVAGHVSGQMLSHYSRIRMSAKRHAVESLEKRKPPQPCLDSTLALFFKNSRKIG
jgi:integrase